MRRSQPLYVSVAGRLEDEISKGKYEIGSLLPTEAELCDRFQASRFTVREAVKKLQTRGLVATRHGTGTVVLNRQPTNGRFVYSFDSVSDLMQSAQDSRLVNIRAEEAEADKRVAEKLQCKPGERLLRIRGRRVVPGGRNRAGKPIALSEANVIWRYADIRDELDHLEGTIGALIERRYGVTISRIEQTVTPCVLSADQARTLGLEPRSLGLQFERVYFSGDDEPFEYVIHVQAGQQARLTMTIRSKEGE
jgi:GntR family transcriptional regulator